MSSSFSPAVASLEEAVDRGRLLGAQVAVMLAGDLVLHRAIGARDLQGNHLSVTDQVPWLCASKVLVGLAALRELERRSMPLSTPVYDVLPEFSGGGREAIQVRHLLDHTAGIRRTRRPCDPMWHGYDHMLEACLEAPLEAGWSPGSDGGYHDWQAAYLLTAVMERTSGQSYERLIDELVLEPAGVADVSHGRDAAPAWGAPNAVMPHRRLWDGRPYALQYLRGGILSDCPGMGAIGPVSALARVIDDVRGAAHAGDPVALAASQVSWTGRDRAYGFVASYSLGFMINMRRYGYGPALPADTFGHAGWDCTIGIGVPELEMTIGLFLNGSPATGTTYLHPIVAAPIVDAIVETAIGGS